MPPPPTDADLLGGGRESSLSKRETGARELRDAVWRGGPAAGSVGARRRRGVAGAWRYITKVKSPAVCRLALTVPTQRRCRAPTCNQTYRAVIASHRNLSQRIASPPRTRDTRHANRHMQRLLYSTRTRSLILRS